MPRSIAIGEDEQNEVDNDLAALNARLSAQDRRRRRAALTRGAARILWRRALTFYWLVCLAVIGMGLNRVYPGPGQHLVWAFQDPARELDAPFASCAKAHANGYFGIPRTSKGYAAGQDPDGDGRACEPHGKDWPDPLWRLRIIEDRLRAPW
jgi:hypothetical protein